ncbi:MAG: hypothetical protein U5N53_25095 [Mycobacterium sp.]|nr:hypothetical protein [Mycobacterium sp.]
MKLVAAVATPSISMLAMNPALDITADADAPELPRVHADQG